MHCEAPRSRSLSVFTSLAIASLAAQPTAAALTLEEIIVTAQKREESLMDVPVSIVKVSGEKMQQAGINNMSQLAEYVPNLTITEGTIPRNIYMRSVGSGLNRSFEQSVGMFIDGIYMGRSRQYRAPFLDLERAEVLRGPQGILFGKNTFTGALNLTIAKPDQGEEFNGSLIAEFDSETETRNIVGVLSSGISDTMGLRLAVEDGSSDGWGEDTLLNTAWPDSDEQIARLTYSWEPSDKLSIVGKFEHSEFESTGYCWNCRFGRKVMLQHR